MTKITPNLALAAHIMRKFHFDIGTRKTDFDPDVRVMLAVTEQARDLMTAVEDHKSDLAYSDVHCILEQIEDHGSELQAGDSLECDPAKLIDALVEHGTRALLLAALTDAATQRELMDRRERHTADRFIAARREVLSGRASLVLN